ncbi:MAG TPA: vWA domain-containing protein [Myxococcota bacterium]|nr:vWA domain-containing protein [Myxococcota bacterium]
MFSRLYKPSMLAMSALGIATVMLFGTAQIVHAGNEPSAFSKKKKKKQNKDSTLEAPPAKRVEHDSWEESEEKPRKNPQVPPLAIGASAITTATPVPTPVATPIPIPNLVPSPEVVYFRALPDYSQPFPFANDAQENRNDPTTDIEPVCLVDTSGSMNDENAPASAERKRDIAIDAVENITLILAKYDSEAARENAEGGSGAGSSSSTSSERQPGEERGGLMTYTFAKEAKKLGDLNQTNILRKFAERVDWAGITRIMPAWNMFRENFIKEFGGFSAHRIALVIMVTDGEAEDLDEFIAALESAKKDNIYVLIGLLGYGEEHDLALDSFIKAYQAHPEQIRIRSLGDTKPEVMAKTLLGMAGIKARQ